MTSNRQVVIVAGPVEGRVAATCFEVREESVPPLARGEVLVRNIYLSCDPHLRPAMDSIEGLPAPVSSRAVGEVVMSRHPGFSDGDVVWGVLRWEEYSVATGEVLHRVDPADGPISHAISVRGVPGLTAYLAMTEVGRPRPGDTVLVSAAAGAVGSVAGQFAKRAGARAVGIVGSPAKTRHIVDVLGFDLAIDYRRGQSLAGLVESACPKGVDVYFDNVGGDALEAALDNANSDARFVVCGMISGYDAPSSAGVRNLMRVVQSTVTVTGFRVSRHMDWLDKYARFIGPLVARGEIRYAEDIVEGIDSSPAAFVGMLHGENIGKRLIRVSEDRFL